MLHEYSLNFQLEAGKKNIFHSFPRFLYPRQLLAPIFLTSSHFASGIAVTDPDPDLSASQWRRSIFTGQPLAYFYHVYDSTHVDTLSFCPSGIIWLRRKLVVTIVRV